MRDPVSLPFWLAVSLVILAAVAVLDRVLLPGVRWFLRRRVGRVIDRLNERLHVHLHPFKLTPREALVDRLTYDPKVLEAAEAHMRLSGEPREAVMRRVARDAREIVPSFRPGLYFRVGYTIARAVARSLYRVRVGYVDDAGLSKVDPRASVVFVMNHRSNMDYVLVAFLAADRTALSYAVGEWARVWPLHTLIRSMGAYFVRRNSGDALYRRILERYVQMATESGVVQAVFLEGGLTRDGALRPPRLGLLDYMLRGFDPAGPRDLVFVPVALNYDRVFEDRTLLLEPGAAEGKGLMKAGTVTVRFALKNLALMALRRWYRFGYACVNFGTPISIKAEGGSVETAALGRRLMDDIGRIVPVLPVGVVATVLLEAEAPLPTLDLRGRTHALVESLRTAGAHVYLPRADEDYAVVVGLRMLGLRNVVRETPSGWEVVPGEERLLRWYANGIAHLVARARGGGSRPGVMLDSTPGGGAP